MDVSAGRGGPSPAKSSSAVKKKLLFLGGQLQHSWPMFAVGILLAYTIKDSFKQSTDRVVLGLGGRPGGYKAGFRNIELFWFKSADQC